MDGARFHGVIGSQEARWLWPDSRLSDAAWTRGVPIDLEVVPAGLVLSPRTRLLRGRRWAPVTLGWDELASASATAHGHTGRTGGLTLREMFEVTLEVVGPRAAAFRMPASAASLLPALALGVDLADRLGFAPLVVTMPHGDALVAAVRARATGRPSTAG